MYKNIILSTDRISLNNIEIINQVKQQCWILYRSFNLSLSKFSQLLRHSCSELAYYIAHEYTDKSSQKVNLDHDLVSLHIENSNPPSLLIL